MSDLIRRQDAIDLIENESRKWGDEYGVSDVLCDLADMPSVKPDPKLYGYPIEHLEMIARVIAKENCTPEDVARMLQNAGEIAKMVRDEMLKMLKESVERSCKGEE